MATATQTITLENLDYGMSMLGQAVDFTPALKSIRQQTVTNTKENFDGERSPDGVPWPKLKRPRSRRRDRRNRHGRGDQVLNDSGTLRTSVTAQGALGNISQLVPTHLQWGTNLAYAAAHQDGATIHKPERRRGPGQKPWVFEDDAGEPIFTRRIRAHTVTIPKREFLGFSDAQLQRNDEIIADHAQRQLLERIDKVL